MALWGEGVNRITARRRRLPPRVRARRRLHRRRRHRGLTVRAVIFPPDTLAARPHGSHNAFGRVQDEEDAAACGERSIHTLAVVVTRRRYTVSTRTRIDDARRPAIRHPPRTSDFSSVTLCARCPTDGFSFVSRACTAAAADAANPRAQRNATGSVDHERKTNGEGRGETGSFGAEKSGESLSPL